MLKLPRRRIRGQPLERERPLARGGARRRANAWRNWAVAVGGFLVMGAAAGVVTIASRPRPDAERSQAVLPRQPRSEAPVERKAERPVPPKTDTGALPSATARLDPAPAPPPAGAAAPPRQPAIAAPPDRPLAEAPAPSPVPPPVSPAAPSPAPAPAVAAVTPTAPPPARTPPPDPAPAPAPEEPSAVSSLGPTGAPSPKPADGLPAAIAAGSVALGPGVSTECLAPELQGVLADLAARFGRVTIVSTHQLNTDNHSPGSVRHKLHLACKAVDFKTQRGVAEVMAYLRTRPEVAGINSYRNNSVIHIDLNENARTAGARAR